MTRAELVESLVLPIRSGVGWKIPAGHVCRITTIEGPQVADLNLWNVNDPRERFWASRTKQLHAAHLTTFNRLWSTLPFLRPMATITADSLEDYGVDAEGGRLHDLLGTRCDPYVNRMLTGKDFDYHCHSNLVRAVLPYGLTEFDVHDVLNVFQCTGLNSDDQYFMKTCPAKRVTTSNSLPSLIYLQHFQLAQVETCLFRFGVQMRAIQSMFAAHLGLKCLSLRKNYLRDGLSQSVPNTPDNMV